MKDYCKILNEIIEAYYDNEYPEYFEADVCKIFEREGITEGYKAEPKRGRWINEPNCWYRCSACGEHYPSSRGYMTYNFCPNCGGENGHPDRRGSITSVRRKRDDGNGRGGRMRLIDADKLKAHYSWWKGGSREMTMDEAKSDFGTIIDLQPTVDPTKHGHWIKTDFYFEKCSNCGDLGLRGFRYCPNCGARMNGGENDI